MKSPKANTPKELCHVCHRPTVYVLEIGDAPKPTCPHCIANIAQDFLKKNVATVSIEQALYPGWHFSLHTAGHMLDIHIMIPTNIPWIGHKYDRFTASNWPIVFVCTNPITQEMESLLNHISSYEELYGQLRNVLIQKFLLEPVESVRQPANEGSDDNGENHQCIIDGFKPGNEKDP